MLPVQGFQQQQQPQPPPPQQAMQFYPAMVQSLAMQYQGVQNLTPRPLPSASSSPFSSPAPSPAPSVSGDDRKKKKRSRDAPPQKDYETTVMLRNIPTQYTPKEVLGYLSGYRGVIDFLYVPIDFKNQINLGYAFINFNRKDVAQRFCAECERLFPSAEKVPFVQPARV